MKKVFLSFAVVCFMAFAASAQTAQTKTEKITTSKEAVATPTSEVDAKGCGKKAGCCHAKSTATAEASTKSCCKGKDAKCDHDKADAKTNDENVKSK